MKKYFKKNGAITLIALVITIIILLILAGVAIASLTGDNGLLNRAVGARDATEKAQEKEQLQMEVYGSYNNDGKINLDKLKDNIKVHLGMSDENLNWDENTKTLTVTFNGTNNKYNVYEDGTIGEYSPEVPVETGVYAKLYDDGTLILSSNEYTDTTKTITKDFGKVENKDKRNYWSATDYNTLVTTVKFQDKITPTSTAYYFNNLPNLTTFVNMSNLQTGLVTSMNSMFAGCTSLTSIDVSTFDTRNVVDLDCMFMGRHTSESVGPLDSVYYTGNLKTLDLSSFNTSRVTQMNSMFLGQVELESINLSSFDTSNVTSMKAMFEACTSLTTLDLSNFNTSNVTNMDSMFTCLVSDSTNDFYYNNTINKMSSLKTIYVSDLWDISKVTGQTMLATEMFRGCRSLVGAIPYDSSKTGRTYANYTTGYLTYKSNT